MLFTEDDLRGRFPSLAYRASALAYAVYLGKTFLAENTKLTYLRWLNDFLKFCADHGLNPETLTKEDLQGYVNELKKRSPGQPDNVFSFDANVGYANASLLVIVTSLRLYYDYLIEKSIRLDNPVGRGKYTPQLNWRMDTRGLPPRERPLVAREEKLIRIPSDAEWQEIMAVVQTETLRNRTMFTLGYDCALRREELCLLRVTDIDPAFRALQVRAETTKGHRGRALRYSEETNALLMEYLHERRKVETGRGPLFLSESKRNRTQPITKWTWNKVIKSIQQRSKVEEFTPHTLRHLRLTDLARARWEIYEIAEFAGHRSHSTTLIYIHLSGRDIAERLESTTLKINERRLGVLKGVSK
ncbi:MAG: site-specific integrase [Blastocatellia bacterium]